MGARSVQTAATARHRPLRVGHRVTGMARVTPGLGGLMLLVLLASCGTDPNDPANAPPGSLVVITEPAGNGVDADGIVITLLQQTLRVHPPDTLRIDNVPVGRHTLGVQDVAAHCAGTDEGTEVEVESSQTATVHLRVECYGGVLYGEWYNSSRAPLFYLDRFGVTSPIAETQVDGNWSGAWSPDGAQMVLRRILDDDMDLFTADLDGGFVPIATRAGLLEYSASWSPDGEWIAYDAAGDPEGGVRLVRPDGTDDHPLFAAPANPRFDLSPVWSPDGSRLAFACWQPMHTICFARPDGTELTEAPVTLQSPQHISWSPDGSRVAIEDFTGGVQAMKLLTLDTWDLLDITSELPDDHTFGGAIWSPDGSRLLVGVARFTDQWQYLLYLTDRDGARPRLVTSGMRWAGDWSPDGTMIAFGVVPTAISVSRPDGTGRRNLVERESILLGTRWRPEAASTPATFTFRPPDGPGPAPDRAAGLAAASECHPRARIDQWGTVTFRCE